MSTRANILVRYNGTKSTTYQYYHHHDGYPEGVGAMLKAFLNTADWINAARGPEIADETFRQLLLTEKDFEDEGKNYLHGDIEYVYYVDLVNWKLTYTHVNTPTMCPFDRDDEHDYFLKLRWAKEGEKEIE